MANKNRVEEITKKLKIEFLPDDPDMDLWDIVKLAEELVIALQSKENPEQSEVKDRPEIPSTRTIVKDGL
jgi:hypothetical protein